DARWVLLQHAVNRSAVKVEVSDHRGYVDIRTLDLSSLTSEDLDGDFLRAAGLLRFNPPLPPVLGQVIEGAPAQKAGLKAGDRIIAIDGKPVDEWKDVVAAVRDRPGATLALEIQRNGERLRVEVVTEELTEGGRTIGRMGAAPKVDPESMRAVLTEVRYGFAESFVRSVAKTWETSLFSLRMLGKMITGHISLKN